MAERRTKKTSKKIEGYLKLQLPAGQANPAPPVGPALGQRGLNIAEFCAKFNDATKAMEKNAPLPTLITIYADKSYKFAVKTPPASWYLKRAAQLEKGGKTPGRETAGEVTIAQCREIAREKMKDLSASDEDAAVKIIAGTARSMGLEVRQ